MKTEFLFKKMCKAFICSSTIVFVLLSIYRFFPLNYFEPPVNNNVPYSFYVINLDSSKERLKSIESQFSSLNLQFKRIKAVDGKAIIFDQYNSYGNLKKGHSYKIFCTSESYKGKPDGDFIYNIPNYKRMMVSGELGHLCSSRKVWEEIAFSSDEHIGIIFEDDIKFREEFKDGVAELMKNLPQKWDVIYIDAREIETLWDGKWLKKSYPINKHLLKVTPFKGVWGTYAYIINRDSAKKLLSYQQKYGDLQTDELFAALIKQKKIQAYVLRKRILDLLNVESTIIGRD